MQVLVYPDHLVFVTDQGRNEVATIQQLTGFSRSKFSRASKTSLSLEPAGWCSIEVGAGIYEIRVNDDPAVLVLLPHRIYVTEPVARELLVHPRAFPSFTPMPGHVARALSDMFRWGLSWALATRILGLGPYGEIRFPTDPREEDQE